MQNNTHKLKLSAIAGMGVPIVGHITSAFGTGERYIPFSGSGVGISVKDTYPQVLASLAANSPTHAAALTKKGMLAFGQGIDYRGMSDELFQSLQSINSDYETINDVMQKAIVDLITYGGFSLQVNWNYNKTISELIHVPFKNVRMATPINGNVEAFVINNNWGRKLPMELEHKKVLPTFNPDKIKEGTVVDGEIVVDTDTSDNAHQLLYFKTYSTVSDGFYPSPDYIGGLDSMFTEIEIGVAMLKNISNGINGAYIISSQDTNVDDNIKQEAINDISALVTGSANAGGLLYLPSSVKVDKLEAIPADTFEAINPEIRQRIIISHGIPSIILGIKTTGGSFSSTSDEMATAVLHFQATTIKKYQNQMIRVLNSIMPYITKEDFKLSIIPFLSESSQDATMETSDKETMSTKEVEIKDTTSFS